MSASTTSVSPGLTLCTRHAVCSPQSLRNSEGNVLLQQMLSLNAHAGPPTRSTRGLSEDPLAFPEWDDDDSFAGGKVQAKPERSRRPLLPPGARAAAGEPAAQTRCAEETRGILAPPPPPACRVPPRLSRPRSRPPLPLRFASASHLALALSAVLVPFTQPQTLLQQRQLSGRRHLPAELSAGAGPGQQGSPALAERDVLLSQTSPATG